MRYFPFITILLVHLAMVQAVAAQSNPDEVLELDQAIREALQSHPGRAMMQARLEAAESYAQHIGAQPNPVLTLSGTVGSAGEDSNALVQTFEISGQPRLRAESAWARAAVARNQLKAQRRHLALETARGYYALWQARQLRLLAASQLELAEQLERTSKRRLEEGAISRNQHLRSNLVTNSARSSLAEAEAYEEGARARLNLLLGRPPEGPVQLAEPQPRPLSAQTQELLEQLKHRPELEAARSRVTARELEADLAARGNSPTLQLSAYQARLGNTGTQGVQLSLVVPLWDWGQQRARHQQAEHLAEAERLQLQTEQLEFARELLEILSRYQAASRKRRFLEQQAADYQHLTDMARRGFDAGIMSLLEVLETERAYRNNAREHIQARYHELLARFELAYAGYEPILPEETP